MRMKTAVPGVLAAVVMGLAVAGCGGASSPAATAPSSTGPAPSTAQTGPLGRLSDLKSYLEQAKPIASELATTVSALPDAVKGLSTKPDETRTTSATKLSDIAAQLDDEASSLAALTPPDGLRSLQAAAVQGIRGAQSAVTKIAETLDKGSATSATRQSRVQSEIDKLQAQLSALSGMLSAGIEGLLGSSGSTQSP